MYRHDVAIRIWRFYFNGLVTWIQMQGLSVPFACVGSGDPVRVLRLYTTNTLDVFEAFITEAYLQLAATSYVLCSSLTL